MSGFLPPVTGHGGLYARPMTASRVAWYAALATAVVWTLKALAIWAAGSLGNEAGLWAVALLTLAAGWWQHHRSGGVDPHRLVS